MAGAVMPYADPEMRREYMRQYDAARREKKRQWRRDHKAKVAESKRRSYERNKATRQSYDAERKKRWHTIVDQLICEYCGRPADHDGKNISLDFHHRDPGTRGFDVGKANRTWPQMLSEIAKCDILCRSCHRRRHVAMRRAERAA